MTICMEEESKVHIWEVQSDVMESKVWDKLSDSLILLDDLGQVI